MNKPIVISLIAIVMITVFVNKQSVAAVSSKYISDMTVAKVINELKAKYPEQDFRIERGVNQVAALWFQTDGSETDFTEFCLANYIGNSDELDVVFSKLERNLEVLYGSFNHIVIGLMEPLHLDMGSIHPIDEMFGAYSPGAHLSDDFFSNKIAFIVMLNFPAYTLTEKKAMGTNWTPKQWAHARMGDMFTQRIPAELILNVSTATTNADTYISEYNIMMGNLRNNKNESLFPVDMKLISHWGLRDELKSNYNNTNGFEKQMIIYNVMLHIINQSIPAMVINNADVIWNPISNTVWKNNQEIAVQREPDTRYQHLLRVFESMKAIDEFTPMYPTYIERAFDGGMELSLEETEALFVSYISSPVIKDVAKLIQKRLGRKLQPFDIWYDGFKARSSINEDELSAITRKRYPNREAFAKELPLILVKLGWDKTTASWISSKISVDPSRGAGHAWGAESKEDVAHLRTRIGANGMDYKGYNIAIHEFGHCVEQTITLHKVPYYMLHGVPNTAFTEAVAFMFQAKDLQLLGVENTADAKEIEALTALDNCWSVYEIMGVSLVDQRVWKWMYQHPQATTEELRIAVTTIAIDVWNQYYAPVFGVKDSPILAIYSHMIDAPLYLSNYPVGHIIEFQIEDYVEGKDFASEITRMFTQGRIIPQVWMKNAVGSEIDAKPCLDDAAKAVDFLKKKK
ncbi:MAG: hypothetical protein KBB11_07960 [Bacteroidales bacterium]|nr:hypothetical protein [Bacteroidales bacterium]